MKRFAKSILFGISGAALAVAGFVAPAAAYSPQSGARTGDIAVEASGLVAGKPVIHKRGDGVKPPAQLGNPSEWGVVKLEIKKSTVHPDGNTCQTVTHGKWCYGYEVVSAGTGKYCYSNYSADVTHKSTVRVINIDHSSGWVAKGETSYANHTQGAAYTCYAYYDNA
ncbi:hypothetical protein [Streptomyces sp. NPDC006739]|uniref:hypothetical protein n=1 Tax=Streptomyces sp. NPDC006739 TaxID=3364763 RepID=UPI003692FA0B